MHHYVALQILRSLSPQAEIDLAKLPTYFVAIAERDIGSLDGLKAASYGDWIAHNIQRRRKISLYRKNQSTREIEDDNALYMLQPYVSLWSGFYRWHELERATDYNAIMRAQKPIYILCRSFFGIDGYKEIPKDVFNVLSALIEPKSVKHLESLHRSILPRLFIRKAAQAGIVTKVTDTNEDQHSVM